MATNNLENNIIEWCSHCCNPAKVPLRQSHAEVVSLSNFAALTGLEINRWLRSHAQHVQIPYWLALDDLDLAKEGGYLDKMRKQIITLSQDHKQRDVSRFLGGCSSLSGRSLVDSETNRSGNYDSETKTADSETTIQKPKWPIQQLRFRNQNSAIQKPNGPIQEPNEPIQKPNEPIQKPSKSRFRNQNSRFRNQVGRFRNQTRRFSNYDSETKRADSATKRADSETKTADSETKTADSETKTVDSETKLDCSETKPR